MKSILLFCLAFSFSLMCSYTHAQLPWSDLDQSPSYSGNSISGVSVDDGYLFLVENEDEYATLVKLSEQGDIVAQRVLGTIDTSLVGELYSYNGGAYFVGYQLPRRDNFSFNNWFKREKIQFIVDNNLEVSQQFTESFADSNYFAFGNNSFGAAGIQEGQVSTVSAGGKLFRHINAARALDTSAARAGSFDFESILETYDLETGEQTQRTLGRRTSTEGQFEGVSDILSVDSFLFLSARYLALSSGGGNDFVAKLDSRGDIKGLEEIDATTIFFSILYKMERSGNQIFANKVSLRDQEQRTVWERRNLNFELLEERIDSERLLCPQERSLRADGSGGVYAAMGDLDDRNGGMTIKRIGADLSELWSAELPRFTENVFVMTAKDGGVILFEARWDSVFVSRFSALGVLLSNTSVPFAQNDFFSGPNPTSDALSFSNEAVQYAGGLVLQLYSMQGQLLLQTDLSHTEVEIPKNLPAGIYLASLIDANQKVIAQRKVVYQP